MGSNQEADGESASHSDVEDDVPQRSATQHGQLKNGPWESQKPTNESSVEDLSDTWASLVGGLALSDVVVLGPHWRPTQVRSHGEVGDGHEKCGSNACVVDETLVGWLAEHEESVHNGKEHEHTEDGKQPVRPAVRDVKVCSGRRIDSDGLVATSFHKLHKLRHCCLCVSVVAACCALLATFSTTKEQDQKPRRTGFRSQEGIDTCKDETKTTYPIQTFLSPYIWCTKTLANGSLPIPLTHYYERASKNSGATRTPVVPGVFVRLAR